MRVVHLSHSDCNGGAARAAWRVHESVRLAGIDSRMLVASRDGADPFVDAFVPTSGFLARLRHFLRKQWVRGRVQRASRRAPGGFEHFRDPREEWAGEVAAAAAPADVYNLHQVTTFLDYHLSLRPLAARAPIVWTLHEMTPMTGGCPYAYDCTGFSAKCGRCPQLGSDDPGDLSHRIWRRKQAIYAEIDPSALHIVCPSRWMAAEAERSSLLGRFPRSVIPYGLDTDLFRPRPEARGLLHALGVAPSACTVLFLADYVNNRRKGFAHLDQALARIDPSREIVLVSIGRQQPSLSTPFRNVHLGSLSGDNLIAAVYSAADIFAIPSVQDNLPNTVMEAMACATPVVGFRVGGIPDMVRDGDTGLLVPPGDVAGFAASIDALATDGARRQRMGAAARAVVEAEYTYAAQAARYLALYRSLTSPI